MNKLSPVLRVCAAAALVALVVSPAAAFNLRAPQIPVTPPSLQNYLTARDGGINVLTDQLDAQAWTASVSGNATFTLMLELSAFAPNNALGVYNAGLPAPLFQVFPPIASPGWYATCHFASGNLVVTLFDNNSLIQGQVFYAGVNANDFGFYLQGPGGIFFTQDFLNGGAAQALTYAGTGQNFGDWWMCWEDAAQSDRDFDDAVLLLQSIVPTPANGTTWGSLKALYK